MRILQISDEVPQVELGGSGRIAWETSRGMAGRGHEVWLLTAANAGVLPSEAEGFRIVTLPRLPIRWAHYRSVFSVRRRREIEAIINTVRPDVIHAHGLAWQMGYGWIRHAEKLGIPCVYTAHGTMHVSYGKVTGRETRLGWSDLKRAKWMMNPLRNPLVRTALNRCSVILCVSDALRTYLERFGFRNMRTLHNGIDLDFWKPTMTKEKARQSLGLPEDTPLFLLAGRIGHDKGSTVIMRTLPAEAHLVVAGSVDASLFPLIQDRVHIFKNQPAEGMRALYAACDAALVPSVYLDPFPTVCLESMACGRPVVATAHGGSSEAVADGVTGWVLDPLNENALRERLAWCTKNVPAMQAMGPDCRRRAEELFSQTIFCDKLLHIYAECAMPRTSAATCPASATGKSRVRGRRCRSCARPASAARRHGR